MDWGASYTVEPIVERINEETWQAQERVSGALSFDVSTSGTDSVPLLETANLSYDGDLEDGWYKLSAIVEQGGKHKEELGVFLFEQATRSYDYRKVTGSLKGSSVLKPVDDQIIPLGGYVPEGADGAQWVAKTVAECVNAPVSIECSFTLAQNVVFDPGTTKLKACWLVLDAGGACFHLRGDGTVRITGLPSEPSLELSRANSRMLEPSAKDDFDKSKVPNRYYAIYGSEVAVAVNDEQDSPTSYKSRGRWVDAMDSSPVRVNGETLSAYAARKLREASTVMRKKSYVREYWPDIKPFDIVRGSLSEVGVEGDLTVLNQKITVASGIMVQETSGQKVVLA